MIDKKSTYAVIGASNDERKYGFMVLRDLHGAGYKAVPINPKSGSILGLRAYPNLKSAPPVDVAVFVVPPAIALKVLAEAKAAGIKKAWFQPGAESDTAIRYCQHNDIECVHGACIMVERKKGG